MPGVSTVNSPAQRTPLTWASTACSSDSSHRRPAGRLVLDDGLQLLVAVAEDVGGNGDGVAYGALDGVPAVVEDRRRLCDPDPARSVHCASVRASRPWSIRQVDHMNLPRTSGVQLHPTSLPSGRLGPEAYAWVDWLASAGQTWWQMLPLGAARQARLAVQVGLGVRGLAGAAGRAGRARHRRRAASPSASARPTGSRTGSRSRARTRSTTRCASTASGRRCGLRRRARREADRRRPDLRRRPAPPTSAPTRRSFKRRRRGGRPAGRVHRRRPALGQPALRLARAAAAGLRVVDRALPARLRALRPRRGSTTSAPSRPTGRCPPDAEWPPRAPGSAARARAPFDAAREALGELPLIAEDLGVITPPVTRCASRSGCRAWRCCSSASRPPSATPSTCRTTTRRTRSSTPAPTTTTRSAAGTTALPPRVLGAGRGVAARVRDRRGRAGVGA